MSTAALMNELYPNDLPLLEPDPQSLREVIDVCRQENDLDSLLSYLDPTLIEFLESGVS